MLVPQIAPSPPPHPKISLSVSPPAPGEAKYSLPGSSWHLPGSCQTPGTLTPHQICHGKAILLYIKLHLPSLVAVPGGPSDNRAFLGGHVGCMQGFAGHHPLTAKRLSPHSAFLVGLFLFSQCFLQSLFNYYCKELPKT